jgi:hypothetical protein
MAQDAAGVAAVLATRLAATSARQAMSPSVTDELANIIERESGWNPASTNPDTKATGLIQFMPDTAKDLGTTVDQLRKMSRGEQAPYVQKFFDRVTSNGKKQLARPGDLYLFTFTPAYWNSPDDKVIFAPGTKAWVQNAGLRDGPVGPDVLPDGRTVQRNVGPITVGGVRSRGTAPGPAPVGSSSSSSSTPGRGPAPVPAGGSSPWGVLLLVVAGAYLLSKESRNG